MPPHRLRTVIPASSHRIGRSLTYAKLANSTAYGLVFLLVSVSIWHTADGLNAALVCDRIHGLSPRQRQLCRAYPDAMAATGNGLSLALAECQFQFQFERWNCTGTTFGSNNSATEATLVGTREWAFVHSIRSAAVAYAVTRACSQGNITGCRCFRKRQADDVSSRLRRRARNHGMSDQSWAWGGCGADVEHGLRFSKAFLDSQEIDETSSMTLVNLHNNRAGRLALEDGAVPMCRCHGTSGSCALRTCWMTLPSFRNIGDRLKSRYREASRVDLVRGGVRPVFLKLRRHAGSIRRSKSSTAETASGFTQRKPRARRLVYLTQSPDYCRNDIRNGLFGTSGRTCGFVERTTSPPNEQKFILLASITKPEIDSRLPLVTSSTPSSLPPETAEGVNHCQSMCCGRGFIVRRDLVERRCRCRFRWCCDVVCQTCNDIREERICL